MDEYQGGRFWGRLYIFLGALVFLLSVAHVVVFEITHYQIHEYLFLLFTGGASASFMYGGYWHLKHDLPGARYLRINMWILTAIFLSISLGLLSLYLGSNVVTGKELLESAHLMGSVGVPLGLLIGTIEARLLESVQDAAQAQTLESERERLKLLNDLLRHYVLNGVSVIRGFADTLEPAVPPEKQDAVAVIQKRATLMGNIVKHISILTKTPWERQGVLEADIVEALEESFAEIAPEAAQLSITGAIPDLYAHEGYDDAMSLLAEAIEQMMDADGSLHVEPVAEGAGLRLTAEPASIPENLQAELFEPVASEVGLELYLAKMILEPAIELVYVPRDDEKLEFHITGESVD